MIPKTIHYCWFGGNPLGPEETRCIESWKRNCLGYEIVRWDESNYDVTKNPYMYEAYEAGKWAFVADYARIDVVNAHGGLYFDTDVEVLRPFDEFLNCSMFAGWESRDPLLDKLGIPYENSVSFGLGYGAECDHPVLQDLLDFYDELSFYNEDGSMNLVACPHYQTESLKKFGLDDSARTRQSLPGGIEIYPEDYFSPKSQLTGEIELTESTASIHHFAMSWVDEASRRESLLKWKLCRHMGYKSASALAHAAYLPERGVSKARKILGGGSAQRRSRGGE